jgi:hypothetical protein
MSKRFRAWKIDEPLFLLPMVQDFVAEDHLSRFVLSLVRDGRWRVYENDSGAINVNSVDN